MQLKQPSTVLGRSLLIAGWFALVFGLVEGAGLLYFVAQAPLNSSLGQKYVNAHILWIAPAIDLVLFAATACVVAVILRWVKESRRLTVMFGLFVFLTVFGWIILPIRLHRAAALILAVGLTVVFLRWVWKREQQMFSLIRRTTPALFAIWMVIAGALVGGERIREWMSIRNLPPATGRPNVLLIVLDTVRADRLSAYGYGRPTTPHFDRLAMEGALFLRAFSTSSWTLPSHASLFTGMESSGHGAGDARLDFSSRTLAEQLQNEGYRTGGFVANTLFCHSGTGLAQGFQHYEDVFGSIVDMVSRTAYGRRIVARGAMAIGYHDAVGRKRAADVNRDFLNWVDARPERPFFAFLNFMEAHQPYLASVEFASKFSESGQTIVSRVPIDGDIYPPAPATPEQITLERDAYDASLAELDAHLAKLMEELVRRGLREKTLIVITSDHGEGLFEHNAFGHGRNLHREAIHIPLLFVFPGKVAGGLRMDNPAALSSVPATILKLIDSQAAFPGADLFTSRGSEAPAVLSELDTSFWTRKLGSRQQKWMRSLVSGDWHFIQHHDGSAELYHWLGDAEETKNVAANESSRILVQKLQSELQEITSKKTIPSQRAAQKTESSNGSE
jgi:arylsulfatase A-like enzyme